MERSSPHIKGGHQGTEKRKTLSESAYSIFSVKMLSEQACRVWLVTHLHQNQKIKCPSCCQLIPAATLKEFVTCENPSTKFLCPSCRKWHRFWSCTPFKKMHIKPHEVFILALLSAQNDSIKNMALLTGRSRSSVSGWLKLINKVLNNE